MTQLFFLLFINVLFVFCDQTPYTLDVPLNPFQIFGSANWTNVNVLSTRTISPNGCMNEITGTSIFVNQIIEVPNTISLRDWNFCMRQTEEIEEISLDVFARGSGSFRLSGNFSSQSINFSDANPFLLFPAAISIIRLRTTQDGFYNLSNFVWDIKIVCVTPPCNITIMCTKTTILFQSNCNTCQQCARLTSGSLTSSPLTSSPLTSGAETTNPLISGVVTSSSLNASLGGNGKARIGIIVGAAAGGAFLAIIIIAVLLVVRNRKKSHQMRKSEVDEIPLGRNSITIREMESYKITGIEIRKKLGSGNYGEVFEGLWNGTTKVACKKLKSGAIDNEINMLIKIRHPNIVGFLGIYIDPKTEEKYLIMEFVSKGALLDFLRKKESKEKLTVKDLISMAVDACSGLFFLEQNGILHRDVAARNLLVTESDGRYIVKIADLGLSREVDGGNYYQSTDNTFPVKWSPPEVIEHRQYTTKSDVWSFGITLWEIFEFGKVPYSEMSNRDTMTFVLKGGRLEQPAKCPNEIYKMMHECWDANPENRPSFKSLHERMNKLIEEDNSKEEVETTDQNQNDYYNNTPKPAVIVYAPNALAPDENAEIYN